MKYCLIIRQNVRENIRNEFIMKTLHDFGIQVRNIKETDIKVNLEDKNGQAALPGLEVWIDSDFERETLHETLKRILRLNDTGHQSYLLAIKDN